MDLNVYIQSIVLCVLNILNISAGVVLNLLVIVSFWKSSSDLRKKLCYFMIMVLSCFDFLVVITTIPVVIIHLILWLDENYDALTVSRTYEKLSSLFPCFSIVALLVLSFERYLLAYYPFFHRTSVNRRRLLTLLAVLLIVPTVIISISVNDLVISFPVALIIFLGIAFPPFVFINYRLFKISRKMRRDNAASPEATVHVNLKKINTCLLAVACLALYIPTFIFIVVDLLEKSTAKNESEKSRMARFWSGTVASTNATFNCLVFFWKNDVLRREGEKVLKTLKNRLFPC